MTEYEYTIVESGSFYNIHRILHPNGSPVEEWIGNVGDKYISGFGWANDFPECCNPDVTGIDHIIVERFIGEEKARQWIRDYYHEEPVNFFAPSRTIRGHYTRDDKTLQWVPISHSPTLEEMKKSMGFKEN